MSEKFTSTIAGASILITAIGILSRGFGFLREVIFAAYFGLGPDFEIYLIAVAFPITINSVLLYLGQNFYIPTYSAIKKQGLQLERELFVRMLILFFAGGFFISLILFFLSDYLMKFYLVGSENKMSLLARDIFRIFIFTIPINAAISILNAQLQSLRKFSRPAYAQLFANLCVIILVPLLNINLGIIVIPIAYVIGSVLQLLFLISKTRPFNILDFSLIHKNLFSWIRTYANSNLLLITIIEVISQFYLIIDRFFYDKVEHGGIAALNYAITVFYLPIAILSVALSTAIFPAFAENLQQRRYDTFVKKVKDSIHVNTFLFVPICIIFFFYGDLVIRLFYQRGNFSSSDTQMTYSVLKYLALSLSFYSVFAIINKIFYGAGLIKQLFFISLTVITLKFTLNFYLIDSMKQDGLALSSTISYSSMCILSLFILTKKIMIPLNVIFWKSIAIYLSNSLLSYAVTILIIKTFIADLNLFSLLSIAIFISIYLFNSYWIKDYSMIMVKQVWISFRVL